MWRPDPTGRLDRCFARPEALLHGAPLDEAAALALWPHAHEGYARSFGVDAERGRRATRSAPQADLQPLRS